MDWLYLAVSVNGALYTINALVPVRRNRVLLLPSFVASSLTIELAWFNLVWQVATTAFFVRKGALRSKPGKLGLLVTIASCAGLLVTIRHSIAARHEVRRAFRDFDPRRPRTRGPVRRVRNVAFAEVRGKTLRLDITLPAVAPAPGVRRPALLLIHGGGWVTGDKRNQGIPLQLHLAAHGWACFNANYRLSPRATFPDHLIDVKRAVVWIRENADEYDIDPDFIAVTGGSAGGHLASLVGLTANQEQYQPDFEKADTSVQAVVSFYGVYDFTNRANHMRNESLSRLLEPYVMKASLSDQPERFAAASPIDQVHEDAPPFLVIHGDLDTLVPVEDARDFVAALRLLSKAPVLYLELRGTQHAFDVFPSIRTRQVVRAVAHFLDVLYDAHVAGVEPADVPESELLVASETAPAI